MLKFANDLGTKLPSIELYSITVFAIKYPYLMQSKVELMSFVDLPLSFILFIISFFLNGQILIHFQLTIDFIFKPFFIVFNFHPSKIRP